MKKFIIFALILLLIVHRTEGCVSIIKEVNFDGSSSFPLGCDNTQSWYDFGYSLFCEWACAVGSSKEYGYPFYYTTSWCDEWGLCYCEIHNNDVWKYMSVNSCPNTNGDADGKTCKIEACNLCDKIEEGNWSASDNKCVRCVGKKADYYITGTTGGLGCWGCGIVHNDFNPDRCESACGANPCCDDVVPGTYVSRGDCKGYCDSDCNYIPWSISISASSYHASSGETVTITAVTNLDLPLGYDIIIYEGVNVIEICSSGNSCSVSVSKSGGEYNYYAKVVYSERRYYEEIVTSNTITVRWYNISLSANPSIQKIGNSVTLTATSSVDVTDTSYCIRIYEGYNSYPNYIKSCCSGTSCSTTVTKTSIGGYLFIAIVEKYDGSYLLEYSTPITVQFVQCLSNSDCPSCSSGVLPRCVNNLCVCYNNCGGSYPSCDANHCCTYDIGESPGTCVSISTVRNYGGKSYLCSP